MCTVIITVPESSAQPVRLLAIRDEDPGRAWDRLGPWWPDAYPGVLGIRDARAGGAWLAANPGERRLAVLLNRIDRSDRSEAELHTRGTVTLESVVGRPPSRHPATHGFNLVEVTAHSARVVSWDGLQSTVVDLAPGTHMVAHHDVDDVETERIARWLPAFRDASASDASAGDASAGDASAGAASPAGVAGHGEWWDAWMSVVARSAELPATDAAAIIRRQSFEGIPSYSLLVCVASVGESGLDVHDAPLETPGVWSPLALD